MGRRRTQQQVVDEATRLVIAYNRAVLLDYDEPSVWMDIGTRQPPAIHIVPDKYGVENYGGGNLTRGQTFRDGVARVKELLHDYHKREGLKDADET